jgi:hypothetical protein
LILLATLSVALSSISSNIASEKLVVASILTRWLQQNDGIFNPKQQLRHKVADDPQSGIGIFATEKIGKGEILAHIPWNLIINSEEDSDTSDDDENIKLSSPNLSCGTFFNLVGELNEGKSSKFQPYIAYLQSTKKKLPANWSAAAQKLLSQIIIGNNFDSPYLSRRLSLVDDIAPDFLKSEWFTTCGGNRENATEKAAADLLVQFAHYELMIPTFDLYTHRNGNWHNTKLLFMEKDYFQIIARRDIEIGEQMHGSYTDCENCNESANYGTPCK